MLSIIQIPQESSLAAVTDDHALSPISEIELAFRPKNWLALLLGGLIGSFIPIASWTIIGEITRGGDWRLWLLAGGGMMFSVLSVAKWANTAFGGGAGTTLASAMKAAGFCALLDGSMAFSHVHELSLAALALLVIINTVSCTTSLQSSRTPEVDTLAPVSRAVTPSVGLATGLYLRTSGSRIRTFGVVDMVVAPWAGDTDHQLCECWLASPLREGHIQIALVISWPAA